MSIDNCVGIRKKKGGWFSGPNIYEVWTFFKTEDKVIPMEYVFLSSTGKETAFAMGKAYAQKYKLLYPLGFIDYQGQY